jgi:hypothetical protein
MELRVRISRLTCAAAVVVVVASCAGPDEGVEASPAAAESSRSSTPSASDATVPQTSVPVPPTSTSRPRPAPTTTPVPKPPQPQPPAPQPQPQPQPPAPPPPNPNPPPGTVSYDLPNVPGSDLADEDNWRSGYENNCTTAGHPTDCLHMSVKVFAPDGSGTDVRIDDPGPNYSDDGVYDSCPVTAITPMPPATVPVGTTVVIEVHCEPAGGGSA